MDEADRAGAPFLRPWPKCLGRAALALYGGHLAAFVTSPLSECGHCVQTFWKLLGIAPGLIITFPLGGSDAQFFRPILAGGATLAALLLVATLQRRSERTAKIALLVTALLAALNGTAIGHALRP